MTQKSAEELEREAEAVRHRMTETAETLQRKLSPGELLDEVSTYLRNSDGPVALHNLKTQVRDNPLPLALVGVGLAWLFMGGGPKSDRIADQVSASYPSGDGRGMETLDTPEALSSSSLGLADVSGDESHSTLHSAAEHARSAGHAAGEAGRHAAAQVQNAGHSLQRMFSDTLDKEPLILGALGVAVGAAVGTMLPTTRAEEEVLAPYGAAARQGAMDAMNSGLERAEEAVSEAVESPPSPEEADAEQYR